MKKFLPLTLMLMICLILTSQVFAQITSPTSGTGITALAKVYGVLTDPQSTIGDISCDVAEVVTATVSDPAVFEIHGTAAGFGTSATVTIPVGLTLTGTTFTIRFKDWAAAGTYASSKVLLTSPSHPDIANGALEISINSSSIAQAPLTFVTPVVSSKVYDGTNVATVTTPLSFVGILNGDDVTLTGGNTAIFNQADVGNNIGITYTYPTPGGTKLSNYSYPAFPAVASKNITTRYVNVVGRTVNFPGSSRVYDGTANVTLSTLSDANLEHDAGGSTGIIAADVIAGVHIAGGTNPHFVNANVGVGKLITIDPYSIQNTGLPSTNYTLIQPAQLAADVTAKSIDLVAGSVTVNTKVYDGLTSAIITGGTFATGSGAGQVIGLDAVSVSLDLSAYTANFNDKHAGTGKIVTVTGCALTGAKAGNYSLSAQPSGLTGTITPKPLTIAAPTISTRAYNATATPGTLNISAGTLAGMVGSEVLGTTTATTPDYFATYAGTYIQTIHYTLADGPAGPNQGIAADYSLADASNIAGVVTPIVLNITAPTIASKVYDGTTTTGTVTPGTLSGFFGTETVVIAAATGTFTVAGNGKHVGVGKDATVAYTLGAGANGGYPINYTLANSTGVSGDVTARDVHFDIVVNNKVKDGNTNATHSIVFNGKVNGDVLTAVGGHTCSFANPNVGLRKPVTCSGSFTLGGADASDYHFTGQTPNTQLKASILPAGGAIGNFVWDDANGNGLQDNGELGLPGVTVQLIEGADVIGSVTTDDDGYYLFSPDASEAAFNTAHELYGLPVAGTPYRFFLDSSIVPGVNVGSTYTIRIPNVTGATPQAALGGRYLAWRHNGWAYLYGADIDSDGDMNGDDADMVIQHVGQPGSVDFGWDCGFTTSGGFGGGGVVPGGGGAGLESKDLGDAVGNRIFNNAVESKQGPVNYAMLPLVQTQTGIRNGLNGIGTSLTLADLLPKAIAGEAYKAYTSTPTDITSITNAKDVLSIDYTLGNSAKAVAFATKTSGEVYDHTKSICDRLKGSELIAIQDVMVNGVKLVRYDLKNPKGQMEFAFSFAIGAKTGRGNYTIQSNWLNKDYIPDEVMFNVQLWAETPMLSLKMAQDVLTRLSAGMAVKEVLSANPLPKTYITKGIRSADNIALNITNTTAGTSGYFEVQEKPNEQSTGYTTRQVPFSIGANGKTSVSLPVTDTYEQMISMYMNGQMVDQVFMADGNWAVNASSVTSKVKSFKVSNDSKAVENKDDFILFRNVQTEVSTPDYFSLYKVLRGGGAPQDLSAYRTLQFTASASAGASVTITLIKDGIINWNDQYRVTIPLNANSQEYKINLDEFTSATNKAKLKATDVTTIIFGYTVNTGTMTSVTASVSKASFTKTDYAYLESLNSTEVAVYPNPSKGSFNATFKSPRTNTLMLNVTDASTGKLVFTRTVDAQIGANSVPVSIDQKSGLGTYILSLEGNGVRYSPKKVLIER